MTIPPGLYKNFKDIQVLPNGSYAVILPNDLVILLINPFNFKLGKVKKIFIRPEDENGNFFASVRGYKNKAWLFHYKVLLTKEDYVEELI